MVADQMADIATDFEAEAAKVVHSLSGMAQDTKQIMVIHGLSDGGAICATSRSVWVGPVC